jgi:probable phosphoglycerate mutase
MSSVFLYLMRHGAVLSLEGKRYIGQMEAPLGERGIEQAWAMRNWLDPVEFSQAFCSDLTRSQRTAKIVVGKRDLALEVLPELREISLGAWEGYSFREIAQQYPAEYEARGRDLENWRPPEGESFGDCRRRVLPVLRKLLASARSNILLVGHAGVNRVILCDALGISMQNMMTIRQDYGCLNLLEFRKKDVRLHLLNFSPLESRPEVVAMPDLRERRKAL